jgi:SAM-dependent MidA family methyltransferase
LAGAAERLASGLLLVIDYGHPAAELYGPRRRSGTLLTYRGHRAGDDPFVAVGRQDITAHVDFTSLDRVARDHGLERIGDTTQARFLTDLGLGALLAELRDEAEIDLEAYLAARAAVARFLDPRHLGAFRVLAWSRGDAPWGALPGFRA